MEFTLQSALAWVRDAEEEELRVLLKAVQERLGDTYHNGLGGVRTRDVYQNVPEVK